MEANKQKRLPLIIGAAAAAVIIIISIVLGVAAGTSKPLQLKTEKSHSSGIPSLGERINAADDFVLVAQNDDYQLYYYEPRFSLKVVNRKSGAVMESTVSDEKDDGRNNKSWTGYIKSGIVINAIVGTLNTYQVDLVTVPSRIETYAVDNGIYARISFLGDYMFDIGVEVKLEGNELSVRIPDESVKENREGTYISTISVLPFMGYTYLDDEEGYMLVPDGNGALIELDNKEGRYTTGFSGLIYGADDGMTSHSATPVIWGEHETVTEAATVLAPVFGMAHTEDELAYLGIVESGDERCSIEVVPNGIMVDYNRCFAKFLLRDVYVQPLNQSNSGTVTSVEKDRLHSDLAVRYIFLDGEDADYAGMACAYRDYLLEKGTLKQRDTSYHTRVDFLGTEREEFLMGTKAVTMTTADEAGEILDELGQNGVKNVLSLYKGWQKGGLYDLPVTDFTADGHIGGTAGLDRLISEQAEKGNSIYLYDDALSVNAKTHSTTYNVMKMVNKRTFKSEPKRQVYDLFYNLMPGRSSTNISSLADKAGKRGITSIAFAGVSEKLFSYSYKGSFYSRTDTMDIYDSALEYADSRCSVILETPNAYLWDRGDAFADMPLDSSDYLYIDREIPFFSIVLKGIVPTYSGYVNFEANKTENFLKMAESGTYPSFYVTAEDSSKLIYTNSSDLYSLEYQSYKDTIIDYDAKLHALAQQTQGAYITDHEVLENGLRCVSYSNGTKVYVNYGEAPLTAAGVTVEPLSYAVSEGV
ncbi:MAG: hypothetical protein J6M90_06685 [Oscillospiraceae bacterium]|nr:hypothetical protein [Oscillospiraceae bacterium]